MYSRSNENNNFQSVETLDDNIDNKPAVVEPALAKTIASELVSLENIQQALHQRAEEASTGGSATKHSDFDRIDRAQLIYAAIWQEIEKINAAPYSSAEDIRKAFDELKDDNKFKTIVTQYMLDNREEIISNPNFGAKRIVSQISRWIYTEYPAVSSYYSTHGGETLFKIDDFLANEAMILSTYKESVFDSLINIYQSIAIQRFHLRQALALATVTGVDEESIKKYEEAVEVTVEEIDNINGSFVSSSLLSSETKSIDSNESDNLVKQSKDENVLNKIIETTWNTEVRQRIASSSEAISQLQNEIASFNPKKEQENLAKAYKDYKSQGQNTQVVVTQIDQTIQSLTQQHQNLLAKIANKRTELDSPCVLVPEDTDIVQQLDASIQRATHVESFERKLASYNDSLRSELNVKNGFSPVDDFNTQISHLGSQIKGNLDAFKEELNHFRQVRDAAGAAIIKWRSTYFAKDYGACTPIRKAWKTVAGEDKNEAKKGYLTTLLVVNPFPVQDNNLVRVIIDQVKWKKTELESNFDVVLQTIKNNVKAKQTELSAKVRPIKEARDECVSKIRQLQTNVKQEKVLNPEILERKKQAVKELNQLEKTVKAIDLDKTIKALNKLKTKIKKEPVVKQVEAPAEDVQAVKAPKVSFLRRHMAKIIGTTPGFILGVGLIVAGVFLAPETAGASLGLTTFGLYLAAGSSVAVLALVGIGTGVGVDHVRGKKRKREDEAFVANKRMNNVNIHQVVGQRPASEAINVPGNDVDSSLSATSSSSSSRGEFSPDSSPSISPQGSPSKSGMYAPGSQSYKELIKPVDPSIVNRSSL